MNYLHTTDWQTCPMKSRIKYNDSKRGHAEFKFVIDTQDVDIQSTVPHETTHRFDSQHVPWAVADPGGATGGHGPPQTEKKNFFLYTS